jgi:hypothetical protein
MWAEKEATDYTEIKKRDNSSELSVASVAKNEEL